MNDQEHDHYPMAALLARVEVEITEDEILADLAYPAGEPLGGWGRDRPASALNRVNGHGGRSRARSRGRAATSSR